MWNINNRKMKSWKNLTLYSNSNNRWKSLAPSGKWTNNLRISRHELNSCASTAAQSYYRYYTYLILYSSILEVTYYFMYAFLMMLAFNKFRNYRFFWKAEGCKNRTQDLKSYFLSCIYRENLRIHKYWVSNGYRHNLSIVISQ